MKSEREIMTVDQVADYLLISKKSVYKLVKEKKLPVYKVINKLRFSRDLVRNWIANECEGNTNKK
jgi:excisionase family DNA binding protein